MYKSTNLLSRKDPTSCFWLRRKGRQVPNIINFIIRSNCSESHSESLKSYFFNLPKCLFRILPDSHSWNHTYKKSNFPVFVNMSLEFLLPACAKSLVDSSPYKYMSCLWSLIWMNRVWGSWYLIIWLKINAHSSTMDFWAVTFSNWLFQSDCLELCFWMVTLKTILTH